MASPALVKRTVTLVNRETGKREKFTIVVGAPSAQPGKGTTSENAALDRAAHDAQLIFEKLAENGSVVTRRGKK